MSTTQKTKLYNSLVNRVNKLKKKIIPGLQQEIKSNKSGKLSKLFFENQLQLAISEKELLDDRVFKLKTIIDSNK